MSSVIGKSTFIYISKYNLSLKSSLIKIVRPFLLLYHIKLLICPAKSKLQSESGHFYLLKSKTAMLILDLLSTKKIKKSTLQRKTPRDHFTSIICSQKQTLNRIFILAVKLIIWLKRLLKGIIVLSSLMDKLDLEKHILWEHYKLLKHKTKD